MVRGILILVLLIGFTGCQSKQSSNEAVSSQEEQRKEMAKKLFAQGVILLQKQDLKGAVESFQASIKVDPTDPNAYLILGQILIKAQQYSEAVTFMDQTAKNFPNNGAAFYMLAVANKFDNKVLPAVLSAKRSYEIFLTTGDVDSAKQSAILVEELIKEAQVEENKEDLNGKKSGSKK